MRYLVTLYSTVALLLVPVAAINWTIDPAGIFQKSTFGHRYAYALLSSKHGLLVPSAIDERVFKAPMAEFASKYDCVVIGSSHVMQVGSVRKHRSFPTCQSILNLGVSGAGFEDHVVLTWLALSKNTPRTIVLGIDPWTFAFDKDERWKVRYEAQYSIARRNMFGTYSAIAKFSNRWSNLINFQYSKRTIDRLRQGEATPPIVEAHNVDEDVGGETSVMLPDGSVIYDAEHVADAKIKKFPTGGVIYKTDGVINEVEAIYLYRNLILWARERGVKPVLLMTPYHHSAWLFEASANVVAMVETEKIVRKIGSELTVPVIGSFRPDLVGCSPNEFEDFMHPMASCVAKFTAKAEL